MAPLIKPLHWIGAVGLLVLSCAQPRPLKPVLPHSSRVEKTHLQGTFLFLKTVTEVTSPGPDFVHYAPGLYLESDKLVRFETAENLLTVASIDPMYTEQHAAPINQRLASFPAEHVDVERKLNAEGDPTHEEEETQLRRPWAQRRYARVEFTRDFLDPTEPLTRAAQLETDVEWDSQQETLTFAVRRELKDGTGLVIRYSFRKYHPSATYIQRPYPLEEQLRFGLFKTTTFALNAFDQFTDNTRRHYMNRWDTSRTIVFHYGPGFPQHLKPMVRRLFKQWSDALHEAIGDRVIEGPLENTGQTLGDLRYNLIHYDDSDHSAHGILGYAPLTTNPRTGEILKADVVLFGRVLKRAVFQELFWEKSRKLPANPPAPAPEGKNQADLVPPLARNLEALRRGLVSDLQARITRMSEDTARAVLAAQARSESAREVESRLLPGVFAHEFGHALGLRHNFLSSSDEDHFEPGEKSSSIMDYGFLHGHRAMVGPYDRAALRFAYSPIEDVRATELKVGYLFCSDEDVFSPRSPLCQLYDAGTRLEELVHNQLDRYLSSYEINNLRLERLTFESDRKAYEARILSLLLPMRLVYDNAHAILQANGNRDFAALWALAKQRVEADSHSFPADVFSVNVDTGFTVEWSTSGPRAVPTPLLRHLDLTKIQNVVDDARLAKEQAVFALRRIILDGARPDFDRTDNVLGRIQTRGVLADKLMALQLIAAPTDHPLLAGRTISPYSVAEKTVPELFASLLSNTTEVQDPEGGAETYYRIRQFDMNLRKAALDLLANEVAQVGRYPEAREAIRLNTILVPPGEAAEDARFTAFNEIRLEFRDFYRNRMLDLVTQTREVSDGEIEFSFADVSPFEQTRNQFEVAFTRADEGTWLTAPLSLPVDNLKTASGLFIRNNLNVAEDYLEAINHAREQLQEALFRGEGTLSNAIAIKALDKRRDALRRYVTGEQLFLQQMYLAFTQDRR